MRQEREKGGGKGGDAPAQESALLPSSLGGKRKKIPEGRR